MSEAAERVMERVSRADRTGALELATQAFASGDRHPLIVMLTAEAIEGTGDLSRAIQMLRAVTTETPDEPEPWRRLGLLLSRTGRHAEAREALAEADDIWPDQPLIVEALGHACLAVDDYHAADEQFRLLETLAPGAAGPIAAQATVAARRGDAAAARELAARSLAAEPNNGNLVLAMTRLMLDLGDAAEAEARATALLAGAGADSDAAIPILSLRADARDAQGDYAGAFADTLARNEQIHRRTGPMLAQQGAERRVDQVRRLRHAIAQSPPLDIHPVPPEPNSPAAHIFVVGFPGSGTTLLEKALAGHSRVRTLNEIDVLGRIAGGLLEKSGAAKLAELTPAEIAGLRKTYLALVEIETGPIAGQVLVDKLPLHSVALPLIARLFPEATIVLSLRDPRDVVLSALRRRAHVSPVTFELLRPADAINYYEAVMELVETCRERLPLTLHEVRHEALVADLEGEVRGVLALAGLEWEPAMANVAARAAAHARTPADVALARGPGPAPVGQWQRYAEPLAPWLPRLSRWVKRWGYAPGA